MSFALRLKAHYAAPKAQHFAEQAGLQLKAERMAEVIGHKKPPVTYSDLSAGFERAVNNGMPRAEADRLSAVLYRRNSKWETLANKKTAYVEQMSNWAAELKVFASELETPEVREELKRHIPKQLREKLTEEQVEAVASEVLLYAREICTFIRAAVAKAELGSETPASRTVGFVQVQATVEAFIGMQDAVIAPLKTFKA